MKPVPFHDPGQARRRERLYEGLTLLSLTAAFWLTLWQGVCAG